MADQFGMLASAKKEYSMFVKHSVASKQDDDVGDHEEARFLSQRWSMSKLLPTFNQV